MNGQELQIEQDKAYLAMEKSNKEAYEQDILKAEKEREYDQALGKKVLELRADGIQASIVEKVAKSDSDIAMLKFEAAVAEATARAAKENINIRKKLFDSLEATKKRELG